MRCPGRRDVRGSVAILVALENGKHGGREEIPADAQRGVASTADNDHTKGHPAEGRPGHSEPHSYLGPGGTTSSKPRTLSWRSSWAYSARVSHTIVGRASSTTAARGSSRPWRPGSRSPWKKICMGLCELVMDTLGNVTSQSYTNCVDEILKRVTDEREAMLVCFEKLANKVHGLSDDVNACIEGMERTQMGITQHTHTYIRGHRRVGPPTRVLFLRRCRDERDERCALVG